MVSFSIDASAYVGAAWSGSKIASTYAGWSSWVRLMWFRGKTLLAFPTTRWHLRISLSRVVNWITYVKPFYACIPLGPRESESVM